MNRTYFDINQVSKNNIYFKANPILFTQLIELVNRHPVSYIAELKSKHSRLDDPKYKTEYRYRELLNWINSSIPLLSNTLYNLSTKCYWIIHGYIFFPFCPICHSYKKLFK